MMGVYRHRPALTPRQGLALFSSSNNRVEVGTLAQFGERKDSSRAVVVACT
jgi:hypothetical protein